MSVDSAPAAPPRAARKLRRRRIIRVVDLTIWMTAAIASVVIAGLVVIYGVQFSRVLSPSMVPVMPVGSIAVTSHIPADQLRIGQVVILRIPDQNVLYIHRVISLQFAPDGLVVRTKGDANPSADPWTVVVTSQEVDVLVFVLPVQYVNDVMLRFQFMTIPLFLFGVLMTTYFGWNAMQSPAKPKEEIARDAAYADNDFNL